MPVKGEKSGTKPKRKCDNGETREGSKWTPPPSIRDPSTIKKKKGRKRRKRGNNQRSSPAKEICPSGGHGSIEKREKKVEGEGGWTHIALRFSIWDIGNPEKGCVASTAQEICNWVCTNQEKTKKKRI